MTKTLLSSNEISDYPLFDTVLADPMDLPDVASVWGKYLSWASL